jgi:hypothetical protein
MRCPRRWKASVRRPARPARPPPQTRPTRRRSPPGSRREALQAFAHELFNALRPTPDASVKGHHGRGFAWGRTSLGDLAERLEALAQKLGGGTTAPADTAASTAPAAGDAATLPASTGSAIATTATEGAIDTTVTGAAAPTAVAGAATPAIESAATGEPAVTVPTPVAAAAPAAVPVESPLMAAFRQLAAALQGSNSSTGAASSPADALAALLHRMSQALCRMAAPMRRPAAA